MWLWTVNNMTTKTCTVSLIWTFKQFEVKYTHNHFKCGSNTSINVCVFNSTWAASVCVHTNKATWGQPESVCVSRVEAGGENLSISVSERSIRSLIQRQNERELMSASSNLLNSRVWTQTAVIHRLQLCYCFSDKVWVTMNSHQKSV